MKKKAKELQKGDQIEIAGQLCTVQEIEVSDIGKQGTQKVRVVAKKSDGQTVVLIRPADYPFTVK